MTIIEANPHSSPKPKRAAQTVTLWLVFGWFALGGLAHFAFTETEMRIVPPQLPAPRALVWISGAFELLGAAGLLARRTRRAAGWGLMALTCAVTPANVYMWQHPERFSNIPYWALTLRLPLQVLLLVAINWASKAPNKIVPTRHGDGKRSARAERR